MATVIRNSHRRRVERRFLIISAAELFPSEDWTFFGKCFLDFKQAYFISVGPYIETQMFQPAANWVRQHRFDSEII
jgi:hypothetical protein